MIAAVIAGEDGIAGQYEGEPQVEAAALGPQSTEWMSSPTKVAVLAINAVELDAGQLAAQRRSSPQQLHEDAAAGRLTLQTVAAEQGVLEGIIIAQEASDVVAPGSSVAAPSGGACTLDDADIYCHETDEASATESHIAAEQAESVSMMCPRRSFNARRNAHFGAVNQCFSSHTCSCSMKATGMRSCLDAFTRAELRSVHVEAFGPAQGIPALGALAAAARRLHSLLWCLRIPLEGGQEHQHGHVNSIPCWRVCGRVVCRRCWQVAYGPTDHAFRTYQSLVLRGHGPGDAECAVLAKLAVSLCERSEERATARSLFTVQWWLHHLEVQDFMPNDEYELVYRGPRRRAPNILFTVISGPQLFSCTQPQPHTYFVQVRHMPGCMSLRTIQRRGLLASSLSATSIGWGPFLTRWPSCNVYVAARRMASRCGSSALRGTRSSRSARHARRGARPT